MTEISIITPIYNCSYNISKLVLALQHQGIDFTTEILIVDNNSTDNSFGIAQSFSHIPNIKIINQEKIQGAAATRNKGIEIAAGDIIAFIDGDCMPEKDWLSQGIKAIQETGADRIGGKIGVRPLLPDSSIYALIDALFCFDQESAVKYVNACMTGNLFVKRSVFKQIGLFNQDFAEMEDMEFGIRAAKEGISVAYADKAIVWHPPRQTFQEMWHKSARNGKGTFILCQHNPKWAGKYGWKHPLRCIKIAISLRKPNWKLLSFPYQQISLTTRIKIHLMSWIVINISEAYGYLRTWIEHFSR
ncbi:glycosyltransferase [Pseudanabaena biceps]|nr:glycosyltransferase [Pseudanabaena biceps]